MTLVLILMIAQGALGFLDTLWHHEISERLTWRRGAAAELRLHGTRDLFYGVVFIGLAWWEWHGAWAVLLGAILAVEIVITLADFLLEDRTRDLPGSERILHTLLAINYGAVLALLAPQWWRWLSLPTGLTAVDHGLASWACLVLGTGASLWGVRDLFRARRFKAWCAAPFPKRLVGHRRILVTGGTGFIGRRLVELLAGEGHTVTVLTRDPRRARPLAGKALVVTDLAALPDDTVFDAVVNLAGEPIAALPWTKARRKKLVDSRLAVTRAVAAFMARARRKPQVLVSASAIGFYGLRGDEEVDESAGGDDSFSHALCRDWEGAAMEAGRSGVRVVRLRIGLVLGADGGILSGLLLPFEAGLGGRIGSGRQWMSWIHLDDVVGLVLHAIGDADLAGPLNATAPRPVRNAGFAAALGAALGRPAVLPVPATFLRIALGQMAEELFLGGQKVLPKRAEEAGYRFLYPSLDRALAAAIGRAPPGAPVRCALFAE
jgi:uncharacterized protein